MDTQDAAVRQPVPQDFKVDAPNVQRTTAKDVFDCDDDGRYPRRHGNWRTATAHIITVVVGGGVLSLGWAMAQIGWVFGPICMIVFSAITWYCANLLADLYRIGDPVTGRRCYSYMDVVNVNLGKYMRTTCATAQYINLFAIGVGYTVTASLSTVAIKRAICFHKHNLDPKAPCSFNNNPWVLMFGAFQIVLSQIPDFEGIWWLSYIAAAMSFGYAFIGIGLSIAQTASKGHDYGTALGVLSLPSTTPAQGTWNLFVALGSIAFAYAFSIVLIEIQDTLASPPSEARSMKKATSVGILIATLFYTGVGSFGYAGFGNFAPGNLLTGFGFFSPYWLVALGNLCIFVHLLGSYQIVQQPVMMFVEGVLRYLFPNTKLFHYERTIKVPVVGKLMLSPLRLIGRSLAVAITTVLACLLPFFNALIGLIGSICFWPLTLPFPIQCTISAQKIPRWSRKWCFLQSLSLVTFLISVCSAIGSVAFLIEELKVHTHLQDSLVSLTMPENKPALKSRMQSVVSAEAEVD